MVTFKKIYFISAIFFMVPCVFSKALTTREFSKRNIIEWKNDGESYEIEEFTNPMTLSGDIEIEKNKVLENLKGKIYNGVFDIASRMLEKDYDLKFISGVISNLQGLNSVGNFEIYSENYEFLINMNKKYEYEDYYSGKHIYYKKEGLKDTIGICCAKWLANESTETTNFGFGIAKWRSPKRIKGLLNEYYKYNNDDDCKIDNDRILIFGTITCTATNDSKKKLSKGKSYEIESNYFMKELQDDYKYIYDNWKKGTMKIKKNNTDFDFDFNDDQASNPSNAAMYFCTEFIEIEKNLKNKNLEKEIKLVCEEKREKVDYFYQVMINGGIHTDKTPKTKEARIKYIYNYLIKNVKGCTLNAIAALLGNCDYETGYDLHPKTAEADYLSPPIGTSRDRDSPKYDDPTWLKMNGTEIYKNEHNPNILQRGLGLGQFTDTIWDDRHTKLINYASHENKHWYDLELQLDFMFHGDSESAIKELLDILKIDDTVENLTKLVKENWIINKNDTLDERIKCANDIKSTLSELANK